MDQEFPMTSSKPYLLRGLFQWIVDNDLTPYILVNTDYEGVVVPPDYVDDNHQIILNISPVACHGLMLGDVEITFNARFAGTPMDVHVPTGSVMAIYARENGQGMIFGDEPGGSVPPPPEPEPEKPSRSHLKVVK